MRASGLLLGFSLGVAIVVAACGGDTESSTFADGGDVPDGTMASDVTTPDDGGFAFDAASDAAPSDVVQGLDVEPTALQTITVGAGQNTPTVMYVATSSGKPVNVGWGIDRGDLGAIGVGPSTTGTFTPSGKGGGMVTVVAGWNGQTVKRQVYIKLTGQQNGPTSAPGEQAQIPTATAQLTQGGGVGGVGGEGLGPAVSDVTTLTALGAPAGNGAAQGLAYLYPYDKTVWPRGLLAPLLQWTWSAGDADAIKIDLTTTSGSFTWSGTFGRPAILAQTGGKFVRHPIPQDVWDMATNTAGGATPNGQPDQLTVSLTLAKGGAAYGPIRETWTVAPARLSGTIYYNSYGTQLAQNLDGAVGGNHMFGGAVLSIKVGDTGPKLVAGSNGGAAQCRVCHSVAANGSRLVAQHGDDYATSSSYALTPNGATETVMSTGATFPGVFPDGSKVLAPSGALLPMPSGGPPIATTGLTTYATDLGTPAFSPDGKLVVFNPMAGSGLANPTQKLVVMAYDDATHTFASPAVVVDDTGKNAQVRPGWPAFFPNGKSIVFEHQSVAGGDGNDSGALYTRKGAKGQIHWTSATSAAVAPLDQLNGKGYLPKLPAPISMTCTADNTQVGGIDADHVDDVDLNYEPTVNPAPSGGYAWVVFTSRRMYGSVADIPPFCSDPRGVDLIQNITPKKLWVAAVDLNGQPGADASHPAFYLPAQEILAGNSRAFWVLDPCRADGSSCDTGDQCCNGYCEPGTTADGGAGLVCTNTPPNASCSATSDKCTVDADCCDSTNQCVNGFCTLSGPR